MRRESVWTGRGTRFALVVAMHVAALAVLVQVNPEVRRSLAPIMVSLITPPEVKPPPEKPKPAQPPKPLPVRAKEPPPPLPLLVAPAEAPTPYVVPVQPEPPKVAPPAEAPPPLVVAAPVPVIPPRFDAAYLDNPAPSYPAVARRMGEQGRVVLRVLVSAAGTAERVELRASSGSTRLDQAALDTVKRWRFVPAKQGTEAVSAWVLVPISFTLEG